jgi:hypothetical protein
MIQIWCTPPDCSGKGAQNYVFGRNKKKIERRFRKNVGKTEYGDLRMKDNLVNTCHTSRKAKPKSVKWFFAKILRRKCAFLAIKAIPNNPDS